MYGGRVYPSLVETLLTKGPIDIPDRAPKRARHFEYHHSLSGSNEEYEGLTSKGGLHTEESHGHRVLTPTTQYLREENCSFGFHETQMTNRFILQANRPHDNLSNFSSFPESCLSKASQATATSLRERDTSAPTTFEVSAAPDSGFFSNSPQNRTLSWSNVDTRSSFQFISQDSEDSGVDGDLQCMASSKIIRSSSELRQAVVEDIHVGHKRTQGATTNSQHAPMDTDAALDIHNLNHVDTEWLQFLRSESYGGEPCDHSSLQTPFSPLWDIDRADERNDESHLGSISPVHRMFHSLESS